MWEPTPRARACACVHAAPEQASGVLAAAAVAAARAGVNGAGKTTQLQIIMGRIQADAGEVIKAKRKMKIAYLAQEFDVDPSHTVRETFTSVYSDQLKVRAGRVCVGPRQRAAVAVAGACTHARDSRCPSEAAACGAACAACWSMTWMRAVS